VEVKAIVKVRLESKVRPVVLTTVHIRTLPSSVSPPHGRMVIVIGSSSSSIESCPTVVRASCRSLVVQCEAEITAVVQSCPVVLPSITIAASQPASQIPPTVATSLELHGRQPDATPINPLSHAHRRPRPHVSSITRCTKRKGENKTGGTRVGHRVQFWLGLLALARTRCTCCACFRRRRSLSCLASHLSSEAVDASSSVRRVREPGRLPNTHALPQTCRWVPLWMPVTFPKPPSHCTALHEPRTFILTHCGCAPLAAARVRSTYLLHTLLYHPFHRATVTRLPETAINPFDETATLA
jgi:hypothetical protein